MAKFKDIEKVIRRYCEWQALRPAMEQRLSPEEFAAQCVMALEDIGQLLRAFDDETALGKLAKDEVAQEVLRRLWRCGELEAHEIADIPGMEGDSYDDGARQRRTRVFECLEACGFAVYVEPGALRIRSRSLETREAVIAPTNELAPRTKVPSTKGKWRPVLHGLEGKSSRQEMLSRVLGRDMARPGTSSDGNGPEARETNED